MIETIFSPCRTWRYTLSRKWGPQTLEQPFINFICLNPSTADETTDDRTIGRCIGFTWREKYSAMVVTNIFAWRATKPKDMKAAEDPIGPENDAHILRVAKAADLVVCAWGTWGRFKNRGMQVESMLQQQGIELHCFGMTKAYRTKAEPPMPKHPLFLSGKTALQAYPAAARAVEL